jgi:hypothetical protein
MKLREELSQANMGELMNYWSTSSSDQTLLPAPKKVKIPK